MRGRSHVKKHTHNKKLSRARLLLPEDAKAAIEEARAGKLDKLTK
jgi:hypothetical protein